MFIIDNAANIQPIKSTIHSETLLNIKGIIIIIIIIMLSGCVKETNQVQ